MTKLKIQIILNAPKPKSDQRQASITLAMGLKLSKKRYSTGKISLLKNTGDNQIPK